MTHADQAASHANKSAKEGGKAFDAASTEVTNFLADLGDLLKSKTSLAGIDVNAIKQQISEGYGTAKDSILRTGSDVVARTKKAAASTDEYVHEEPWKSIGIGVAFGFLLGALVSRR